MPQVLDDSGAITQRKRAPGTTKQQLVELIVGGMTLEQAAQRLNVRYLTAARWIRDPEFAKSKVDLQKERLAVGQARLIALYPEAPIIAQKLMQDDGIDPMVRLRAAQTVLEAGNKLLEGHPNFRPDPGGGVPLFSLPPGTRVLAMFGAMVPPTAAHQGPAAHVPGGPAPGSQVVDPTSGAIEVPAAPLFEVRDSSQMALQAPPNGSGRAQSAGTTSGASKAPLALVEPTSEFEDVDPELPELLPGEDDGAVQPPTDGELKAASIKIAKRKAKK